MPNPYANSGRTLSQYTDAGTGGSVVKNKGKKDTIYDDNGQVLYSWSPVSSYSQREINEVVQKGLESAAAASETRAATNGTIAQSTDTGTGNYTGDYQKPSSNISYTATELKNDPIVQKAAAAAQNALQKGMDPLKVVQQTIADIANNGFGSVLSQLGSLGETFSSGLGSLVSAFSDSNAKGYGSIANAIQSASDASTQSYNDVMEMIRDTTAENNAWSAAEAQKNRDWQAMMSNTVHQREVQDLKAAGLNPVLAAGGSGASTGSGAVAQPDTSNTRMLAEVSMAAIEAAAQNAEALSRVATANTSESFLGKLINSKFGGSFARGAGMALSRGLVNAGLKKLGLFVPYSSTKTFYIK